MPIAGERVAFPRPGEVVVERFELPDPGSHQVLVRTERTAISAGTELTTLLGAGPRSRFPAYPGYSSVGVVEKVGEGVDGLRVGDHVLSMGRHQTHLLLDLAPDRPGGPEYLEPVPSGLASELAAFAILGSVGLHGLRRAEPRLGEAAAVFGQGIVGQLLVQLLRAARCHPVLAVD